MVFKICKRKCNTIRYKKDDFAIMDKTSSNETIEYEIHSWLYQETNDKSLLHISIDL